MTAEGSSFAGGRVRARPGPRPAGTEFLLLAEWERSVVWLFEHTEKWPRNVRASLTQRVENAALEHLELLLVARYRPEERLDALDRANLLLERLRYFCRMARSRRILSNRHFEAAARKLDAQGRLLFGWRQSLRGGRAQRDDRRPREAPA